MILTVLSQGSFTVTDWPSSRVCMPKWVRRSLTAATSPEHGRQRAHPNTRSTWNTTTASVHATVRFRATLNTVHRSPTSRRCAAIVATHGV